MFKFTKQDKRTNIEKEIDEVLKILSQVQPDTKEYSIITTNLERLYKAKSCETDRRISLDTIGIIAGNLLGIALILGYERANIITTKALGFVLKGRV